MEILGKYILYIPILKKDLHVHVKTLALLGEQVNEELLEGRTDSACWEEAMEESKGNKHIVERIYLQNRVRDLEYEAEGKAAREQVLRELSGEYVQLGDFYVKWTFTLLVAAIIAAISGVISAG